METAARVALRVPVFGWFLKDAIYGAPDAKYYFIANLVVCFAALVYFFGYPFLIIYALTATAVALVSLIILTASDMFRKGGEDGVGVSKPVGRSTKAR
ncbi:hypothetical protein [Xanthobacter versatilis]|uniref:Uncharacterized protein n=1 Tax=Xanthobacter autotrophicus (strain ATCC BAA-1158 / Py2) TaxID=78245 RepID=A7INI7_XANP2|nr:hypothetical protein Xaut_4360 [Xanthobacter autotrophicus Py2]